MSSNQLKCVSVSYIVEDCFKIPKHINLEDKTQVENWGVKYNVLHIYLTNGEKLEISSEGWIDSFDYKHPSNFDKNQAIVDAAELGIDDDDSEEEEEEDSDEE